MSTLDAIRPLSDAGGAELIGIDARLDLDDAVKERIRAAFARHGFIVLRGQDISLEDQLRFGRIFGEISAQGENAKETGGVTFVSNAVEGGTNPRGELTFHIDHSFYPKPLRAIMLYAMQVPPHGGDTMFANARLAYARLPQSLRDRIDGLRAMHVYDYAYSRGDKAGMRIREADIGPEAPRAVHPVALIHPVTGEHILYVSRRHVDRILDIPEHESEALLDELMSYFEDPSIIYVHQWRVGDLVVFDNLAVQHARTDFDPQHKRHMRRIQIA